MPEQQKLKANCHCGGVALTLAKRPDFINDCNCSLCSASGAIWGYFSCEEVEVTGPTQTYRRQDYQTPAVQLHSCETCGATTHWTLTEEFLDANGPADRMGVNMRLFDFAKLAGVIVRFPDGRGWDGKSDYGYRRADLILGKEPY